MIENGLSPASSNIDDLISALPKVRTVSLKAYYSVSSSGYSYIYLKMDGKDFVTGNGHGGTSVSTNTGYITIVE